MNYERCGKPACHSAKKNDTGHGPRYLWNATIGGKSRAKHLKIPEEIKQYSQETKRYRQFVRMCEQLVEVNERLYESCAPVAEEIANESEAEINSRRLSGRH